MPHHSSTTTTAAATVSIRRHKWAQPAAEREFYLCYY